MKNKTIHRYEQAIVRREMARRCISRIIQVPIEDFAEIEYSTGERLLDSYFRGMEHTSEIKASLRTDLSYGFWSWFSNVFQDMEVRFWTTQRNTHREDAEGFGLVKADKFFSREFSEAVDDLVNSRAIHERLRAFIIQSDNHIQCKAS